MEVNKAATIWGLAEATLFFIVPDVWLSIVGRDNLRKGLIACAYSLIGALFGGALLFWWGSHYFTSASLVLNSIPAIDQEMLTRVQSEISEQGLLAMVLGPLSGTPYKIYAINSAHSGISFWWFLLLSIPARLVRFISVVILSYYLSQLIRTKTKLNPLIIILGTWLLFYSVYFYVMP